MIDPNSSHGPLNSTTEVELVAAPSAGVDRAVVLANIYNKDTASITYTISKKVGGTLYQVEQETVLTTKRGTPVTKDKQVYLTGTDQSLVAVLAGVVAANQPTYVTSWVDKSAAAAAAGDSNARRLAWYFGG